MMSEENGKLSRKEVDDLQNFCKEFGAKGLGTIAVTEPNPQGVKTALAKFVSDDQMARLLAAAEAEEG